MHQKVDYQSRPQPSPLSGELMDPFQINQSSQHSEIPWGPSDPQLGPCRWIPLKLNWRGSCHPCHYNPNHRNGLIPVQPECHHLHSSEMAPRCERLMRGNGQAGPIAIYCLWWLYPLKWVKHQPWVWSFEWIVKFGANCSCTISLSKEILRPCSFPRIDDLIE